MNTLHDLTDAFDELERRADEHAAATHPAADRPTRPARRRTRLVRLAPIASALAVLAVAVATVATVTWVHHGRHQVGSGSPTPTASVTSAPTPSGSSAPAPSTSPTPSSPTSAPTRGGWSPPSSADALAAQTRSILGTTATITVIDDGPSSGPRSSGPLPTVSTGGPTSSPTSRPSLPTIPGGTVQPLPDENGAAIRGLLTADGRTGGYDLNVSAADPSTPPLCADADLAPCSVTRPAAGGYLVTQTVRDRSVPGGVTVTVERVRRDGADILVHLSTERDPKGSSPVTSPTLPLTVQQLIAFVSSDRW